VCLRIRSEYNLLGPKTADSTQQKLFRSLNVLVTDAMSKPLMQRNTRAVLAVEATFHRAGSMTALLLKGILVNTSATEHHLLSIRD